MSTWQHKVAGGAKVAVGLLGMACGAATATAHILGGVASGRVGHIAHGVQHGVHQVKHAAEVFAEGLDDLAN